MNSVDKYTQINVQISKESSEVSNALKNYVEVLGSSVSDLNNVFNKKVSSLTTTRGKNDKIERQKMDSSDDSLDHRDGIERLRDAEFSRIKKAV